MPLQSISWSNDSPECGSAMVGALNSALEVFCLQKEQTFDGLLASILQPIVEVMEVDRVYIDRQIENDEGISLFRVFSWDKTNGVNVYKDEQMLPVDVSVPESASTIKISVYAREEHWGNVVYEYDADRMSFDKGQMNLIQSYALLCASAFMRSDLELEIVRQNEINILIENDVHRLETESEKIYYDPLTGIYNRRFFDERLSRLISTLSRSGGLLSFLMIDIDNFKSYNDSFGHAAGDDCLKTIAQIFSGNTARTDDFVVRYGGDEFAVVLPNTEESGARMIAEKILRNLNNHVMHVDKNGVECKVTASIGVATGKVRPRHRPDDFILRADELLYKSKQAGRNRYTFGYL